MRINGAIVTCDHEMGRAMAIERLCVLESDLMRLENLGKDAFSRQ
ncbi:MAG: hypothetical protein WD669_07770 [Pirellulales bacterium]